MSSLTLFDLEPGEKARVCGFSRENRDYRLRLLTMGLTPNTAFQVIRRAPLGDPIQIKIRDYHLSLRQKEAQALFIERMN